MWLSSVSHALHTPVQSSLCAPGAEPHQISLRSASTGFRLYLNRSAMYRKKRHQDSKNLGKLNPPTFHNKKGLRRAWGLQWRKSDSRKITFCCWWSKVQSLPDAGRRSHLLPLSATALGQPSLPTHFLQNQRFLHTRLVMDKPLTQLPCALHILSAPNSRWTSSLQTPLSH